MSFEKELLNQLKDLKENHHIHGIKISFEDEGLTLSEAQIICRVSNKLDLPISLKIGGCEARRDMIDAKVLGIDHIVAPMIESEYALKKFVEAAKVIYNSDEFKELKLTINIETYNGYLNLKKMEKLPEFKFIWGITLGRVDFTSSQGLARKDVDSEVMKKIAMEIALFSHKNHKKMTIGGAVTPKSLDFFASLPDGFLSNFETRNIIFDYNYSKNDKEINQALSAAMSFELNWMKQKKDFYERIALGEESRISMISNRLSSTRLM